MLSISNIRIYIYTYGRLWPIYPHVESYSYRWKLGICITVPLFPEVSSQHATYPVASMFLDVDVLQLGSYFVTQAVYIVMCNPRYSAF